MTCTIISNGHEIDGVCKNEHEEPLITIKHRLREIIWQLYCNGYNEFFVNCNYGIPLWSAEIITALKIYNEITLNIVVPFEEQCRNWDENNRDRYYTVHEKADNIEFACYKFEVDCEEIADKIMLDNSDFIVIFGKHEDKLYAEDYSIKNNIKFTIIPLN